MHFFCTFLLVEVDSPFHDKNGIFNEQLYDKKFSQMNLFFFQKFDFLRSFCHKDLKQALMPKVSEKVKVLKNRKKSFFQN